MVTIAAFAGLLALLVVSAIGCVIGLRVLAEVVTEAAARGQWRIVRAGRRRPRVT
jgi:hypothetical protein